MGRIRLGYTAKVMEENGTGSLKETALRSASGQVPDLRGRVHHVSGGWKVAEALIESDLDIYMHGGEDLDTVLLSV